MKYFKNNSGTVFAYESDGSQDAFIGNKTQLNQVELDALLAPVAPAPIDHATVTKLQAVRYWQSGGLWPSVKAMLTADADLHDRWIAASELVITDPDVIALGAALEAQTGTALQQMFNEAGAL